MQEAEARLAVIEEAKTWLNTPHRNGARVKGAGVDCGQLPHAVYSAVGLVPQFDIAAYPRDFHLHKSEEWYLKLCEQYGREIPGPPLPGDFCIIKIGRVFSHGAIVVNWPLVIHAHFRHGVVYGDALQEDFADREIKFFTVWGG